MFDIDKICDYYGYSKNFDNCSYILKNGKILLYETERLMEHFEVEKFYKSAKCSCKDICGKPECENKPNCRYAIRNQFMILGNVRCRSDVGMFHIISGNINWNVLKNYIEHHIFYNDIIVQCDYQKTTIKNDHIFLGDIKNMSFDKDNYQQNIEALKRFYE